MGMCYIFLVLLFVNSSFASSVKSESTLEDESGLQCCYEDETLSISNTKKYKTILCKSAFKNMDTSALYNEIIHRVEITNFIINNESEEFFNDLIRIIHETNVRKEEGTSTHEEEEESTSIHEYDYGFWFYNCKYSFENTGTESNESSSEIPTLHDCQHFKHFNIYLEEGEECKNVLQSLKQWYFTEQNKKS